jgi:hypothetical protein
MPETLRDGDWQFLLGRINDGLCTPFLGAGACDGVLPLGKDVAEEWAAQYLYPLADTDDLCRVAQYVAVEYDYIEPKRHLAHLVKNCTPPDFTAPDEPHAVLACLPLPIYLTTNYDSFMTEALRQQGRNPRRETCCWNKSIADLVAETSEFSADLEGIEPDSENPLVFHFHGCETLRDSIVVTEDDYLEFLVSVSSDKKVTPARIRAALTETTLLFIGYGLRDWTFRVLWRGLVAPRPKKSRFLNVAIQLPPEPASGSSDAQREVRQFLDRYYHHLFQVRVFWGTAREFAAELRQRWEAFSGER